MPCFRGIDLSLATPSPTKVLPEFPHPDGSSVRLLGNLQSASAVTARCPVPANGLQPSSSGSLKGNPTISVYVPSLPGVQFWLRYRSITIPPQAAQMYFKMFMNGRLITAWGVDPKITPQGNIMRALYEPSESWHYMENGETFKPEGIESRYFHFTPGPEKPVAEDGGLIEIRAWRSQSRQRRAPTLDSFRSQEKYGIASPSGGLLDNPQGASYYTYSLIDPVDMPYATFKFHYRSWGNLFQFKLIPEGSILQRYAPLEVDSDPTRDSPDDASSDVSDADMSPLLGRRSAENFNFGLASLDGAVFKDDMTLDNDLVKARTPSASLGPKPTTRDYSLKTPPKLRPVSLPKLESPEPSKALRDGSCNTYLHRPLPELPPNPSPDKEMQDRVRRLSSASRAPSITPSLLQKIDDEGSDGEDVVLGVAQVVTIPESSSRASLTCDKGSTQRSSRGSSSDYETSPPSSNTSSNQPSPQLYDVTTGSILEADFTYFSPTLKRVSPNDISPKARKVLGAMGVSDFNLPSVGTVKLSESQWMRGVPSPIHRRFGWHTVGSKRSDSERRLGKSLFSGFRKHKTRPESVDFASLRRVALTNSASCLSQEVKGRTDNWI